MWVAFHFGEYLVARFEIHFGRHSVRLSQGGKKGFKKIGGRLVASKSTGVLMDNNWSETILAEKKIIRPFFGRFSSRRRRLFTTLNYTTIILWRPESGDQYRGRRKNTPRCRWFVVRLTRVCILSNRQRFVSSSCAKQT